MPCHSNFLRKIIIFQIDTNFQQSYDDINFYNLKPLYQIIRPRSDIQTYYKYFLSLFIHVKQDSKTLFDIHFNDLLRNYENKILVDILISPFNISKSNNE